MYIGVDAYIAWVLSPEQFVSAQFFLASAKEIHILNRAKFPEIPVTKQLWNGKHKNHRSQFVHPLKQITINRYTLDIKTCKIEHYIWE